MEFTVYGAPQPKGSTRGFVIKSKKTGKLRAIITSDNTKARPWATEIRRAAAAGNEFFKDVPVRVHVSFGIVRPKSVKRPYPTVRPDADKLLRTVLDALKGVSFQDDGQVVAVHATKRYSMGPAYATITVTEYRE